MYGGDLLQLLNNERLGKPTIVRMLEQMLIALGFLNEHRIIHGDIKPENIFLRGDGNIVLGDFGCAKQLSTSRNYTYRRYG